MIAMVDGVVIDDKLERADPKPIKGGPMTKHLRVLRGVLCCVSHCMHIVRPIMLLYTYHAVYRAVYNK